MSSDNSITRPVTPMAPPATSVPTYATRAITLTFQLTSQSQQIQYTGLRVLAQVTDAQAPYSGNSLVRANGIPLSDMNELTVAGYQYYTRTSGTAAANYMTIAAGDSTGMATVFTGVITDAYPDGNQPDMGFIIKTSTAIPFTMPPATPTSFPPGGVSAKQVFQQIASKMGLSLKDNGITGTLSNPYYSGSIYDQFKDALQATNCYGSIDLINKQLIVTHKQGPPTGDVGVIFSPVNAMIGYPQFETANIVIRTLYDPALVLVGGSPFTVQNSQFTAANGKYYCSKVDYAISSQLPGGPWEMVVRGYPQQGVPMQ